MCTCMHMLVFTCNSLHLFTQLQLGIIGLVEEEWIATLSTVDSDDITFLDFVDEGRRLACDLKEQVSHWAHNS